MTACGNTLFGIVTGLASRRFDPLQVDKAIGEQATAFYGLMPFLKASDQGWIDGQAQETEKLLKDLWYWREGSWQACAMAFLWP